MLNQKWKTEWKRDYGIKLSYGPMLLWKIKKRGWLTYMLYVRVGYYDIQYYLDIRADVKHKKHTNIYEDG